MKPTSFLDWSMGHEQQWPIRWEWEDEVFPNDQPSRRSRRWVTVEDGPTVIAIHGRKRVQLRFPQPSHRQAFRFELSGAPRPFACWLELDDANAPRGDGRLGLVRTALPVRLEQRPEIVIGSDVLASVDGLTLAACEEQAGFRVGQELLMVVSSPALLAADDRESPSIDVFLAGGARMECLLQGAPGGQYLVATRIERQSRQARTSRFVAVPSSPRFIESSDEANGSDLGALLPQVQHLVRAWVKYEEVGRLVEEGRFETRRSHPLEYDALTLRESSGEQIVWEVSLPRGSEALEHWIDEQRRRAEVKVAAAVEIYDLEASTDPIPAVLQTLQVTNTSVLARVTIDARQGVPPPRGRIVAIEDRGDATQRRRRSRALERLRSGQCACPDLLGYLLDPSTVPPAIRRHGVARKREKFTLNDDQWQAVFAARNRPPLLLIQGPPGTGKTKVIVEIVRELRRIHRSGLDDQDGLRRPLRILVTSVQRQAVLNVLEKLQDDCVFIRSVGLDVDRDPVEIYFQQGQRIAERLEDRSRRTPSVRRFSDLRFISDQLDAARAQLVWLDPARLKEILEAIAAADQSAVLNPSLRGALTSAIETLATATQDVPVVAGHGPVTATLQRCFQHLGAGPADLSSVAFSNLRPLIADAHTALAGLSAGVEIVPSDLHTLALRWKRFEQKHGDDLQAGEVERRAGDEWRSLVAQSARAAAHTLRAPTQVVPVPVSVESAVAWIYRATDAVAEALAEFQSSEEAAIFDWVDALRNRPGQLREVLDKHAATAAATCQKADPLRDEEPYDVVIVDEAARAGLDVLVPVTVGRSVILVGDHRQLPPHVENAYLWRLREEDTKRINLERESLFSWLMQHLPTENKVSMRQQFRMHEQIGRLVSEVFYEPDLTLEHYYSGTRRAERSPDFGLFRNRPLVWLDTSDVLQNELQRQAQRCVWPCQETNTYEADLIIRLLQKADRQALERMFQGNERLPVIGLISFYKDQVRLLGSKVESLNDPSLDRLVRIGTVASFQGHEFPLVILSCVRSNADGKVGFLKPLQHTNVAMSRAQRQLIVVGDSATLAANHDHLGSAQLKRAFDLISEWGGVVRSGTLEG